MENHPSQNRSSELGSGMINEFVQRLGEPQGKPNEEKYGGFPQSVVVFFLLSHAWLCILCVSLHGELVAKGV
jgi:hypothetical protein